MFEQAAAVGESAFVALHAFRDQGKRVVGSRHKTQPPSVRRATSLKLQCRKAPSHNGKYVSVDDGNVKLHSEYLVHLKEFIEAGNVEIVTDHRYLME